MHFIHNPWPWYVAGPLISFVLFMLLYFGKTFGMSSNLRTICSIGGAGRLSDFFILDWRSQQWNLVFAFGAILGGFLTSQYLSSSDPMALAPATLEKLDNLGIDRPTTNYLPDTLFSIEALSSPQVWAILLIGGFLVGFGARYAGGCTSGHAITGLSNLQLPSFISVVGFFIGGLTMVHILFPLIFAN